MQSNDKISKVSALYKFLRDYSLLKGITKINIDEYDEVMEFSESSIPHYKDYVTFYSQDFMEEQERSEIVLSVKKPQFQECPQLSKNLLRNLQFPDDAYDYREEVELNPVKGLSQKEKLTIEEWLEKRKIWREEQLKIEKVYDLFQDLYLWYSKIKNNNTPLDLIVGNGFINCKNNKNIDHPLILKYLNIKFDENKNTIFLLNTDTSAKLYTSVFQFLNDDLELSNIGKFSKELEINDYHPLDMNKTPEFLERYICTLSSRSQYMQEKPKNIASKKDDIFVYNRSVLFLSEHNDRSAEIADAIVNNLEHGDGECPSDFIIDIVAGGNKNTPVKHAETIDEQLAAVGGESIDIFLSMPANDTQLEIAKKIEVSPAVLVQGPPGTGKTHTIANLLGHFLAQGKSVLVTSHTKKALSVLKDKIPEELQALCVDLCDQSNKDMQKAVAGINEFLSRNNIADLEKRREILLAERNNIITNLSAVRRNIFACLQQEYNSIVIDGKGISPIDAAKFVQQHSDLLDYIPGNVKLRTVMPCSYKELVELYRFNDIISVEEEKELLASVVDPRLLLSPSDFEKAMNDYNKCSREIEDLTSKRQLEYSVDKDVVNLSFNGGLVSVDLIKFNLNELKEKLALKKEFIDYEKNIINDSFGFSNNIEQWKSLVVLLEETVKLASNVNEFAFSNDIVLEPVVTDNMNLAIEKISELKDYYSKNKSFGWMDKKFFKKDIYSVRSYAKVNGREISNVSDCEAVLNLLMLKKQRMLCEKNWNNMLATSTNVNFESFSNFEADAMKYVPNIKDALVWREKYYKPLEEFLLKNKFPLDKIFCLNQPNYSFETILDGIDMLSGATIIISNLNEIKLIQKIGEEHTNKLSEYKSDICNNMRRAISEKNIQEYIDGYSSMAELYKKYADVNRRDILLEKIKNVAPEWARYIRDRVGVHGNGSVDLRVADAWLCKQYYSILNDMNKESLPELQDKSVSLANGYRQKTKECACVMAWIYLMNKIEGDISLKQNLNAWALNIKKLGKGTGKNASRYRNAARECMKKCKDAVPVWIMPLALALDNFDPKTTKFDIVIIDEASQADITALIALYMAKKVIVVGDDEQVSPSGIGMVEGKIIDLQNMFLKNNVSNYNLYNSTTSLYDIVQTTFPSIMLIEHFRCVPDIIGFSNMLSYNGKIKPLRESSSSNLLPAVVNYRVDNGCRGKNKTNDLEAHYIAALMKACIEQPEYDGKTFGVISMLGNEQAALVEKTLSKYHIGINEIESRNIICGNAANFQGDERDVIFLSLVDSGNGKGPITLKADGKGDMYKQRYNVATSRAQNQLWVVHSLDADNDLKPEDIRKRLLEYTINPRAYLQYMDGVKEKAESPFEEEVARILVANGYHIEQQWEAGAYRIDIVAVYKDKKIAIECDGEQFHSGEEKIREDMQRQAILERLGWRFIRIRGSEFYREKDATMERVIATLNDYGIMPEVKEASDAYKLDSELLQRVSGRAQELLIDSGVLR